MIQKASNESEEKQSVIRVAAAARCVPHVSISDLSRGSLCERPKTNHTLLTSGLSSRTKTNKGKNNMALMLIGYDFVLHDSYTEIKYWFSDVVQS